MQHIDLEQADFTATELELATAIAEKLLELEVLVDSILPPKVRPPTALAAKSPKISRFMAHVDPIHLAFPDVPNRKIKVKKLKAPEVPFGEYGEWDYNNADWQKVPTLADIPQIMKQKQLRYPNNQLWKSEEKMLEWFKTKGWTR